MGFFDKLKSGLEKTRRSFTEKIEQLISGTVKIDEEFIEDLEAIMLSADIGINTTNVLIAEVRRAIKDKVINTPEELKPFLKERVNQMLAENTNIEDIKTSTKPYVILVVGVNGVGKTTTIGKLGYFYSQQNKKVMFAAADTFRAAAIDQLEIWSKRVNAEIIKHSEGADPAAVSYDAIKSAIAKQVDVLIIDTAGRLHTKSNLMEELKKVKRVVAREISEAPHAVYLVLDATTGQNAINQAKIFGEAVDVSGVILTKLDGTAKGGVVVAIKNELNLPIKWIGVGEGIDDLRPFDSHEFADALFNDK